MLQNKYKVNKSSSNLALVRKQKPCYKKYLDTLIIYYSYICWLIHINHMLTNC